MRALLIPQRALIIPACCHHNFTEAEGARNPEMGTLYPRPRWTIEKRKQMKTVYFDWSGSALAVLWDDEDTVDMTTYRSVSDLLDDLTEPTRIVSEATFESFNLDMRREVIERAEREGHTWLTTPNRQTKRMRDRLGWTKSDAVDVQVIREIDRRSSADTLKRPVPPPDEKDLASQIDANHELMRLRNSKVRVPSRAKKGYTEYSKKQLLAREIIKQLPKFKTLTDTQKLALGGDKYSECIVAAVAIAAKYSSNRREFENLAGLHGHGYPTQIRADLHFHGWANMGQIYTKGKKRSRAQRMGVTLTLSEWRREIRWLYHHVKQLV